MQRFLPFPNSVYQGGPGPHVRLGDKGGIEEKFQNQMTKNQSLPTSLNPDPLMFLIIQNKIQKDQRFKQLI